MAVHDFPLLFLSNHCSFNIRLFSLIFRSISSVCFLLLHLFVTKKKPKCVSYKSHHFSSTYSNILAIWVFILFLYLKNLNNIPFDNSFPLLVKLKRKQIIPILFLLRFCFVFVSTEVSMVILIPISGSCDVRTSAKWHPTQMGISWRFVGNIFTIIPYKVSEKIAERF